MSLQRTVVRLICFLKGTKTVPEKDNFLKTFIDWFAANSERFVVEPELSERKNNSLSIRFAGIAPEIGFTVSWNPHASLGEIAASVTYKDCCWDILQSIEVEPRRNSSGKYYCEMCKLESRKFYSTYGELLAEHSFETFLEWINKNFNASSWLCFMGQEDHYTYAEIADEDKTLLMRSKEDFLHAEPVMKEAKERGND